METLRKVVLVHPEPIVSECNRQRCFCGRQSDQKMLLCDGCDEWYHFDCIGVSEQEARELEGWPCGYCRAPVDGDGNQSWVLAVPQRGKKKPKVAPQRRASETPKALGVAPIGAETVMQGPNSWEEIEVIVKERARKLRVKEKAQKKQAEELVKEGGHHIVDAISLGGVVERGVDKHLVDDLAGLDQLGNVGEELEEGL